MKIALLNLPVDNNYGGNLQRYALMKVLHDMGHSVTHLNLRFDYRLPWYKKPKYYGKRFLLKVLFKHDIKVFFSPQEQYEQQCSVTDPFYQKYINHTEIICNPKKIAQHTDYDAFIVGSDQVWRKKIAGKYMPYLFFSHIQNIDNPKIACAVSFGTDTNELDEAEKSYYGNLYKKFNAVSVRETSGLKMLDQLGWSHPKATHLFDPTFMLSKTDYQAIIRSNETKPFTGNIFCYILDMTEEKENVIKDIALAKNLTPFYISLDNNVSIPQWLRAFDDAEYIITDSFHGLVFSIIFNKPFKLIKNSFRGNARFDSVIESFNLNDNQDLNWDNINNIIQDNKRLFVQFLESALK